MDSNPTSSQNIDQFLVSYLTRKGYFNTLQKLIEETRNFDSIDFNNNNSNKEEVEAELENGGVGNETLIIDYLLNNNDKSFDPKGYFNNYDQLVDWINDSLEIYKPELRSFLYPIFVHSYLDLVTKNNYNEAHSFYQKNLEDHLAYHSIDLNHLSSIKTFNQVNQSELCQLFRKNKFGLKVSKVGFELLISYLQDKQMLTILRLINDYFSIKVISAIPGTGELSDPIIGITGHDNTQLAKFHSQPVTLGHPLPLLETRTEIEQLVKEIDTHKKRKLSKVELNNFNSLMDLYKDLSLKKFNDGYNRDELPLPPPKGIEVLKIVEELQDLNAQVNLIDENNSKASICFYTFHNTQNNLNVTCMSDDLSLLATGFGDSYIKLWSMKNKFMRNVRPNFNPTMVNDESDLDRMREKSNGPYRKLIGHSGPIYGLSFSKDNKYLLSSSEDGTVRLWNCDTYACLASYKGHNYPIWDVDFSPYGVYFVTGSHDRTARLWSTEHASPLRIFSGHLADVDCVKFHPNGKYVITGSSDHTSRMYDISTGLTVRIFTGHVAPIETLAISPDGLYLSTAGSDGILLFCIPSGKLISTYPITNTPHALTFSSDSQTLISGGSDQQVTLWKINLTKQNQLPPPLSLPALSASTLSQPNLKLISYPTKKSKVTYLKCTTKNLILGIGIYNP